MRTLDFFSLSEKTLGIVGMGRIGQAVAKRAAAFGMRVVYYQRNPLSAEEEQRFQAGYAPLDTLLATWGLSLMLQQTYRSVFGPREVGVELPPWMMGSLQIGYAIWVSLYACSTQQMTNYYKHRRQRTLC